MTVRGSDSRDKYLPLAQIVDTTFPTANPIPKIASANRPVAAE
jgi:hypothetical protein